MKKTGWYVAKSDPYFLPHDCRALHHAQWFPQTIERLILHRIYMNREFRSLILPVAFSDSFARR